jgi:hypothetical protein
MLPLFPVARTLSRGRVMWRSWEKGRKRTRGILKSLELDGWGGG